MKLVARHGRFVVDWDRNLVVGGEQQSPTPAVERTADCISNSYSAVTMNGL